MTPEQVKARFEREGKTFAKWAKEKGFEYRTVIAVINGMNKRFDGAWLMLDASALPHPSDLTRAGGLLLRVAKGYHY
ncbi:hypothetical protein V4887_23600, partial [Ralstonia solanacearum species complex bacterium KE449]|uniref:hypothetical protein n=1 Tax=Ralstonia solanacearum species complex bacterium KE449 TaxID=3119582 RepID=UPI002FC2B040